MMMETLPTGTVLHGRYRIERVLGSGGFGHVYLSLDLQTNQQYAIKEYLVAGASGKAQLEHEARVLSQLHHSSLPAFQIAFDERGHHYVVLSYIDGRDLTDIIRIVRLRNEVVPLSRIISWIISICDAVTFLHSQNPPIIHRDIKPDNIRITSDGTAVLVDLGNAKAAADGARTLFFIRHQGTPGYAPLEQYPGGSGTDIRSDVFALGGTLYFALTTHEPPSVSVRTQSVQQGLPDLPSLQEQLAHNPPETSAESGSSRQFRLGISKPAKPAPRHSRHLAQLGTLPPELLDQLNAIIKRAMAMKPIDRYKSVADLSKDLKMVLAALPASTLPATGSSHPVDQHSTQPDLPLLFEALQNAQAAPDQAPPDISATSPPSPAQTSSPAAPAWRCPRCNAELLRQASFCPRCGSPLAMMSMTDSTTTQPPAPTSIAPNTVMPDASPEPALLITPQLPEAAPLPKQAPIASPKPIAPQDKVFSPVPPRIPSKPFIQSSLPRPVGIQKATNVPSSASNMQPTKIADLSETRKLLTFLVIVVVVVLLLALLLIVLAKAGRPSSSRSSEQRYAIVTQVCTCQEPLPLNVRGLRNG
jgi:serine/threonine protein kinase